MAQFYCPLTKRHPQSSVLTLPVEAPKQGFQKLTYKVKTETNAQPKNVKFDAFKSL